MKKQTLRSGLMATTTICGAVLSTMAGLAVVAGVAALPTEVLAQSAVGSVNGKTDPGATVQLSDTETGVTQSTTADSRGEFSFTALPPGIYTVTAANGTTETIEVKAGVGTTVALAAPANEIIIRGSRTVNPIDVKSVESTTVFTAAQIAALPVQRDVSSVALLAPGTVKNGSPADFGNVVSIGGSSVAENGYYINGFDVTNARTFLSFADLPFDAIGQLQIKTGGYGAEYGRSLGGVVSQVTKRGTNKWKFGGSMQWMPSEFKQKGRDVLSVDPALEPTAGYYEAGHEGDPDYYHAASDNHIFGYRSANESSSFSYTNYVSGPLIEDKLFVFAAITGQSNQSDVYRQSDSYHTSNNSPQALVKLDWYITPDHHVEYTGIRNKDVVKYTTYQNDHDPLEESFYSGRHEELDANYSITNGGEVDIFKYTGHLTDNFTLSVMAGHLKSAYENKNPPVTDPAAALCPRAFDSRNNPATTTYIGCYSLAQIFIPDLSAPLESDQRDALRIDAEWNLGDHSLRFGYDSEKNTSTKVGEVYTGGEYWRHYYVSQAAGRSVNGVLLAQGTNYARRWVYKTGSSAYEVENTAWYIEDSWQFTPNLVLYGGLRSESFTNRNGSGDPFVSAENSIAPRLGFSWDVNGDGSLKVFGNAGRYYIPVASNTNIRASGTEATIEDYFITTGVDTATGLPIGQGAQIGGTNINGTLTPPDPTSVADADLAPMYQDEFILGAQKELSDSLTLGVRSIYREVKNGMDDHCTYQPYVDWAEDNGFENTIDLGSIAPCVIINPGQDVTLSFDADGDGAPELNNVGAEYYMLPNYKRSYMAVEVFGDWKGPNWTVNGSYTLSASRGNVEGYVNTSLGQIDAGATQDFDNFKFEDGAGGFLPNDRRHVLKLFGTYRLNEQVQFAGNLIASSGRPINCFGFVDTSDPAIGIDADQLALYSASSFYCMSSDGNVALKQRGTSGRTDWNYTFDFGAAYTPNWANGHVTFKLDVFNLFNSQTALAVNEVSEKGSASSFSYSPNYGLASQFQTPRAARIAVYYNF